MVHHLLCQSFLLSLISMLKELLDHIIAEEVHHQLEGIGHDLLENSFLFIAIGTLKLLLNEPRSMLISAEFNDMAVDILDGVISDG